ncbi:NUDIX hydrolase domain-like protein [Pilobolus umbonatus]|nr:NUDIX hydrolase domain-like protein [Pilobolus umbonatus]
MTTRAHTLIFVLDEDERKILLGMKKRGFGAGRYNGFGGKVELQETTEEGARRELREEAGIEAVDMENIGINHITRTDESYIAEIHIYITRHYHGTPVESDEMVPQWFSYNTIPYSQMWPDASYWLPDVLARHKFTGHFHFSNEALEVISYK